MPSRAARLAAYAVAASLIALVAAASLNAWTPRHGGEEGSLLKAGARAKATLRIYLDGRLVYRDDDPLTVAFAYMLARRIAEYYHVAAPLAGAEEGPVLAPAGNGSLAPYSSQADEWDYSTGYPSWPEVDRAAEAFIYWELQGGGSEADLQALLNPEGKPIRYMPFVPSFAKVYFNETTNTSTILDLYPEPGYIAVETETPLGTTVAELEAVTRDTLLATGTVKVYVTSYYMYPYLDERSIAQMTNWFEAALEVPLTSITFTLVNYTESSGYVNATVDARLAFSTTVPEDKAVTAREVYLAVEAGAVAHAVYVYPGDTAESPRIDRFGKFCAEAGANAAHALLQPGLLAGNITLFYAVDRLAEPLELAGNVTIEYEILVKLLLPAQARTIYVQGLGVTNTGPSLVLLRDETVQVATPDAPLRILESLFYAAGPVPASGALAPTASPLGLRLNPAMGVNYTLPGLDTGPVLEPSALMLPGRLVARYVALAAAAAASGPPGSRYLLPGDSALLKGQEATVAPLGPRQTPSIPGFYPYAGSLAPNPVTVDCGSGYGARLASVRPPLKVAYGYWSNGTTAELKLAIDYTASLPPADVIDVTPLLRVIEVHPSYRLEGSGSNTTLHMLYPGTGEEVSPYWMDHAYGASALVHGRIYVTVEWG